MSNLKLDLLDFLCDRQGITRDDLTPTSRLACFIGFRTLIYCDEMHDFMGVRSKLTKTEREYLKTKRLNRLLDDINWFKRNGRAVDELDESTHSAHRYLVSIHKKYNLDFIKHIKIDNYNKPIPEGPTLTTKLRRQDATIINEGHARIVSEWILKNIFMMDPIPISLIMGCAYDLNIYTISQFLNYTRGNIKAGGGNKAELYINVDATMSGSKIQPIYSTLFNNYMTKKNCSQGVKDIMGDRIKEEPVGFFETLANKYDPANQDGLMKTMKKILSPEDTYEFPMDKQDVNLLFDNIPIISYKFVNIPTTGGVRLHLDQYFGQKGLGFKDNNAASVAKISNLITDNQKKNLAIHDQVAFKTMGDFLQVISFYMIDKTYGWQKDRMFSFVTGDILCGRLASIFSRNVILELDNKMSLQDITNYLKSAAENTTGRNREELEKELKLKAELLRVTINDDKFSGISYYFTVKDKEKLSSTTQRSDETLAIIGNLVNDTDESLDRSMKYLLPEARFGKKPKVSIRNTSTRVLKAKLKSVGVPVTKVVRGKRMKLTRKQLEMRAEAFKRLQIRCQKKGINLTYVSKKGRKYKSAKRLLSDLKRKSKFKPKPKTKPKMKWG